MNKRKYLPWYKNDKTILFLFQVNRQDSNILPCMYLKICVWTDVAESLFAGTPSPASITYSGLPEDETSFGQCGGPEFSIANFNYKS